MLCIHICRKRCNSDSRNPANASANIPSTSADLERFRHQSHTRHQSSTNVEERRELIRKNLFTKTISGEKSVADLARLLAISRGSDGGMIDEEIGFRPPADEIDLPVSDKKDTVETGGNHDDLTLNSTHSDMTSPEPSAPPLSPTEITAQNATDNVHQEGDTTAQGRDETSVSLLHILANLTHNVSIRLSRQPQAAEEKHYECSICLEEFNPNDTIGWAKDGGDPTTISNSGSGGNTGCDHIFHQGDVFCNTFTCSVLWFDRVMFLLVSSFFASLECLVSWLESHDDCPLCRRKVVHADAAIRFAGWGDF